MDLSNWPSVPGRYYIGNKNSCVAVCTLSSVDLLENFNKPEYLSKISLVGKDVTENVGIEKIVQNTVSNPCIRFIILCGKESEGHSVAQAISSLIENGVDEKNRIIGAKGPIPFVKNLTRQQIETFRKQVKIIDLIGCDFIDTILTKADECEKENPGIFESKIEESSVRTIIADYNPEKEASADGSLDEGWFNIFIDREKNLIVAEHYIGYGSNARLNCRIVGKRTEQILGAMVKEKLINQIYHAGYVGKELAKAEMALKKGIPYEQEGKLE